jgi:hypothetical protein
VQNETRSRYGARLHSSLINHHSSLSQMIRRIAASMSLVAFAVCLLMGLRAGNPFSTIVANALLAMAATFAVGLVVGAMAQKMLDENLAAGAAVPKDSAESKAKPGVGDR